MVPIILFDRARRTETVASVGAGQLVIVVLGASTAAPTQAHPKPLLIDSQDSLDFELFSARWRQVWLSRLGRLDDLVRR